LQIRYHYNHLIEFTSNKRFLLLALMFNKVNMVSILLTKLLSLGRRCPPGRTLYGKPQPDGGQPDSRRRQLHFLPSLLVIPL
jgi:hypothetical protein